MNMRNTQEQVELESAVLRAMREKTGILAVGRGNFSPQQVLEELDRNLDGYYGQNGKGIMIPTLEILQRTPNKGIKCYPIVEQDGRLVDKEHHTISIAYYGSERTGKPLDKKADYAVSWLESTSYKFGVYFNLATSEESRKERDEFMEFARRQSRLH
jgi:ADP-ribose pyrophosphatase YjhB (NUDIX family)